MSGIKDYSTSAASNNAAPPNGAPEGQTPSSVNNVIRQVMADIRSFYESADYIDLGHTPTYASSVTFLISGDVTAYYTANRLIKCTDSSTLYGYVSTSAYSAPNTTVTVVLDSGSLSASLSAVAVGLLDPTYTAISAASSKFIQSGTGAVATDLQTRVRWSVYVFDYMTAAQIADVQARTLSVDVSAAIKAAAASLTYGGDVIFPPGAYLCSSAIYASEVPPYNIRFLGMGQAGSENGVAYLSTDAGVVIKYTGSGTLFGIQLGLGASSYGMPHWENMLIWCSDGAANGIQMNDPTADPTLSAGTNHNYPMRPKLKNVRMRGANAGASQSGHGLSGSGIFELVIEEDCLFEDWDRGVWLHGCDNATIKGRFNGNTIHVLADAVNTFGNGLKIESRFFGDTNGSYETQYGLHLSTDATVINPTMEISSTMFYFNDKNIHVYSPILASNSGNFFELGADAVNVNIYNPIWTGTGANLYTTIATPTSWEFGSGGSNYTMTIWNPIDRLLRLLSDHPHPRIRVVTPFKSKPNCDFPTHDGYVMPANSGALRIPNKVMNPFTFLGDYSTVGLSSGFSIVADSSSPYGYAFRVPATDGTGFDVSYAIVGKGIQNGDVINIRVNYIMSGTPGAGTYRVGIYKNGSPITSSALSVITAYGSQTVTYTLSGFTSGDEIEVSIYNSSVTDQTLNVADVSIYTVQAANADTSLAFTGSDTTSVSDISALQDEVNQIKAALRAAMIISS